MTFTFELLTPNINESPWFTVKYFYVKSWRSYCDHRFAVTSLNPMYINGSRIIKNENDRTRTSPFIDPTRGQLRARLGLVCIVHTCSLPTRRRRVFSGVYVKPCPHQQQCRSNIVECYKSNNSFDKLVTNWTCSICFDFIERTKLYDKLVRHCCCFWQQYRMLLRESCLLLQHCCWCGRGFSVRQRSLGLK